MAPVEKDNLTAVLYKVNDLRLEQRPIPVPKDNEVLLEMGCVGICGSDVHYLTRGRIADFIVKEPIICGHEASGTVAQVGKNVTHLKKGDRVAIEPGVPCCRCEYCKDGKYVLCPDVFFCATPPYDGNLTRYYVHAADFCFKLPDHVSLEEGALMEPLAVGVHACRKGGVALGSNVLITGSGTIGITTMLTAKSMGASSITMTDINPKRLEFAKKLGADNTVLIKPESTEESLTQEIIAAVGDYPNITIDCSGFESSIRLAIQATKPAGTIVLVGMGAQEVKVSLIAALVKELRIVGSYRYCNDHPIALAMVAAGKYNFKDLITHNYVLEDTVEAFEKAKSSDALKVMIHVKKQ